MHQGMNLVGGLLVNVVIAGIEMVADAGEVNQPRRHVDR